MDVICPKCGYTRKPGDRAPDWECPKCGVVYAKLWYRNVRTHATSNAVVNSLLLLLGGILIVALIAAGRTELRHRREHVQEVLAVSQIPAADWQTSAALSPNTIDVLCAEYEGQPAFLVDKQEITLDCAWIQKLAAASKSGSIVASLRQALTSFATLDQLLDASQSGRLPPGLSACAMEQARAAQPRRTRRHPRDSRGRPIQPSGQASGESGEAVQMPRANCHLDIGVDLPIVFETDAHGALQDLRAFLNYEQMYRELSERSLANHRIAAYHEPWIKLQGEILLAGLRQTVRPGDEIYPPNARDGWVNIYMQKR